MPKPPSPLPCFEDSLARLEEVASKLEDGQLSLGDALSAYEDGIKHLKVCFTALDDAERKIEILSGFDAAGNPVTQAFDDTATAVNAEENVARRSRSATKTAAKSAPNGEVDDSRGLF